MSAILILIGFSLLVAIGFLIAFLWAVKSGQFDDKVTPSIRILLDKDKEKTDENNSNLRSNK